MIRKVLVANRGEIAIRAFRAANELGVASVAVFAFEDRYSLHRQKADESYEIGTRGRPVRSYLDIDEVIRVALLSGADAVYPGYGFLSENPDLAAACTEAGLAFVGPPAEVLRLAGNKVAALDAARAAGLPTLRTAPPQTDPAALVAMAEGIGFPLFVKASAGGGGRGLRLVATPDLLAEAIDSAVSEAASAFGDGAVFLEQAVIRPRHIEVQILADASGKLVHLLERDCSIQRRHQKVIEIAPAPGLDPELRDRLCADAVTFARSIGYRNAGTVEFLVEAEGRHVFIEMNPRIQVEHTVTEEVTSVDLVQAQLRIAGGASLDDLGLDQGTIAATGAALQCRITTEDPAHGFRPDVGRITAYRSPGGAGVRLDGGTYPGAEILPFFDSLLVKQTCRGRTFADALARSRRALAEFRVRGVTTNIPFLQAILATPELAAGRVTTAFLEDHPDLAVTRSGADRGTRMLSYLADVTVNKPYGSSPSAPDPATKLPSLRTSTVVPDGSRQRLEQLGPAAFAASLRAQNAVAVTDTTLRDAHQSLLATRVRTFDMVAVAPHLARALPGLLSLEAWGGATYDVALRFLKEDPWDRLAQLREAAPNLCLQMLLRGRNTVGYTPYPDRVAQAFVAEAARTGVDIFRVFDAFNDVEQMRPAIEAVIEAGKVAEGTLCYSGDLSDPAEHLYTLDYYLRLAEKLVGTGCHVLCIKDMAGLLRAPAASTLVANLRERFDLPVHLHTHDTAGGQLATYLAAIDAGVDAVDGAAGPLAGTTSQPPLAAIVAATDHTGRATGLSLDELNDLEPYWATVRQLYAPFESGLGAPTGRVYRHEIPGGQLSNLRTQAIALGLGDRFEQVEDLYAAANAILGRIVKVTPSSKVVGDLALYLCGVDAEPTAFEANPGAYDIPDSVIGFLHGELGVPPGGWPEPFRTKALAGRAPAPVTASLSAADDAALDQLDLVRPTLNRLLFAGPTREYDDAVRSYGDLSVLPTRAFLYGLEPDDEIEVGIGAGISLFVSIDAVGEVDDGGYRTVYCRLNGQSRALTIRDRSAKDLRPRGEKATPSDPTHIAAPFAGVVNTRVAPGDQVTAGQTVATIEAMKMEAAITTTVTGTIERVAVDPIAAVEGGDLLLVVTLAGNA
jgi:pyruvate carboxylase